jgi:hypothetical protein
MRGTVCFMLDTKPAPERIRSDAQRGPHPRFSPAAVERAKTLFNTGDIDKIGTLLGFSRAGWWRARVGKADPRLSEARRVASRLGLSVDEVFEGGRNA